MSASPRFLVDVIIPVHTTERPLDRCVASVLAGGLDVGGGGVRVLVVCHNVDPGLIRDVLRPEHRDAVTLLELRDGSRSPGPPRNHGLDHVEARFVCFLDSDDVLDAGALARWTEIARRNGSAVVVPRLTHVDGRPVRTPVTRPWRSKNLDVLADRLVYRTSLFGLLRTDSLERLGLRFPEHHRTGEDQSFSLPLYAGAGRVDYARGRPGYTIHDDAVERITTTPNHLAEDLAAFVSFSGSPWLRSQPLALRRSYAVKVLRVHVFGGVDARTRTGNWSASDARAAQLAVRALLANAPGAARAMSRADRTLVDLLEQGETDAGVLGRVARARRRFGTPATLLPRDLSRTFHRDGSLRFLVASALMS